MDEGTLKKAFEDRQGYWGWQSIETVMSDPDWQALLERDLAIGEIGEPARRIFKQYGAIEYCSGGFVDLVEGQNHIMFKIVGKNEKSTGLNFDLSNIICERIEK